MYGKKIRVVEYNLTFGAVDKYVNVFGFFKYKLNGNMYIVYTDVDTKYELIYYGSSHIKNNNLLSMACKEEEQEIIKEYIYKVVNNESLDNFEIFNLDDITGLELISANRLDVKLDVIRELENNTLSNNDEKNEKETPVKKEKKVKKNKGKFLIFIMLIFIMGGGYFYLTTIISKEEVIKVVKCNKEYDVNKVNALVNEINTYTFKSNDILSRVDSNVTFKFDDKLDYEDFINSGNVFNYMPKDSIKYNPNHEELSIEYISEVMVDDNYNKPVEYESLITYYKNDGYSCTEQIEK